MKPTVKLTLLLFIFTSLGAAQAQTASERVQPFTVERYALFEVGAIALQTFLPDAQNVSGPEALKPNVYLSGPDGYLETFESDGELTIDDLVPGRYSLALTDNNLRLVEGAVEVRPGETVYVEAVLFGQAGFINDTADVNFLGFEFQLSDWYEEENALVVAVNVPDARVSVTGPDGYHTVLEGETFRTDDLDDGVYSVTATAEGYKVATGRVAVANGQQAQVQLTLEPLE